MDSASLPVDRAPLDARLSGKPGLSFVKADAAAFKPRPGSTFDALLSDLNGPAEDSLRAVLRLAPCVRPGGLIVFTLKTPGAASVADIAILVRNTVAAATAAGLAVIAATHLTYNRREFTVFMERRSDRDMKLVCRL